MCKLIFTVGDSVKRYAKFYRPAQVCHQRLPVHFFLLPTNVFFLGYSFHAQSIVFRRRPAIRRKSVTSELILQTASVPLSCCLHCRIHLYLLLQQMMQCNALFLHAVLMAFLICDAVGCCYLKAFYLQPGQQLFAEQFPAF